MGLWPELETGRGMRKLDGTLGGSKRVGLGSFRSLEKKGEGKS